MKTNKITSALDFAVSNVPDNNEYESNKFRKQVGELFLPYNHEFITALGMVATVEEPKVDFGKWDKASIKSADFDHDKKQRAAELAC